MTSGRDKKKSGPKQGRQESSVRPTARCLCEPAGPAQPTREYKSQELRGRPSASGAHLRPPAQSEPEPSGQCWEAAGAATQMDVMLTDPDARVGLLQAQACNMRSKCRCSCVLQFTLCHAFSCVLHRPPSQLIHCIVLYALVVQTSRTAYTIQN